MRYVSYILDAEEPVKMGDQGNQANCDALSYIAGSAIRGAVIAECVKAGVKVEELVKNTRFYDAYVVTDDEYAAPIPFEEIENVTRATFAVQRALKSGAAELP